MDELLQEFVSETSENLASLDVELVRFEQRPEDRETLGSIFRLIHTIKGTCGFLGLPRLERVAHAGEDLLDGFRSGTLAVTPEAVTLVLECIDAIRLLLNALQAAGEEPQGDDDALIGRLRTHLQEARSERPHLTDDADHTLDAQGQATRAPQNCPVISEQGYPVAVELLAEVEAAEGSSDLPEAGMTGCVGAAERSDGTSPSVGSGEIQPRQLAARSEGDPTGPAADASRRTSAANTQTIRVRIDVLESLMTLASELVLTRNQLAQRLRGVDSTAFAEPFQRLSLITTDLQQGVMKTRVQPIGHAWAKLPRIIRDLCVETGKKVELKMNGEDTELDRQVLEVIRDPLTHMIRNAADHGIEGPDERRAAGKLETGTIVLNACHESGHVIITVADDGKGLDSAQIGRKAVECGLVAAAELQRLTEQQIQQFIFRPGFSTAKAVTNVSGRGVGMDVVRTNVERIGGTVELRSAVGRGTTFTIKIPLTLGIVSALIVGCGGERYAIPQISVRELVRVCDETPSQVESINDALVLRLRNKLLPLMHLRNILRLDQLGAPAHAELRSCFVVVTRVGSREFGVIVDELFDTEEIVIKPVARILRQISVYSGNTILGDGSVVMILDPNALAASFDQHTITTLGEDTNAVEAASDQRTSFIVFRSGPGLKAFPMGLVARIEMLDGSAIEHAGGRSVVQYRGQLMPLVELEEPPTRAEGDRLPVLVFADKGRLVGFVVEEIVDIVEGTLELCARSADDGVIGTVVIGGKATDIIDVGYHLSRADADWFGRDLNAPSPSASEAGKAVLLVDDSPFFLGLIVPSLAAHGYRVETAVGAEQALAMRAEGRAFDLIVSDIEMPGMDGFAFAEAVRSGGPWAAVPLVALSSNLHARNIERARTAGYREVFAKARRGDLLRYLEQGLDRHGRAA